MTTLAEFFSRQRIRPLAEGADNDADAATFHWLCVEDANPGDADAPPQEAAGALVFIKGDANTKALSAWLEAQGLITRRAA